MQYCRNHEIKIPEACAQFEKQQKAITEQEVAAANAQAQGEATAKYEQSVAELKTTLEQYRQAGQQLENEKESLELSFKLAKEELRKAE